MYFVTKSLLFHACYYKLSYIYMQGTFQKNDPGRSREKFTTRIFTLSSAAAKHWLKITTGSKMSE